MPRRRVGLRAPRVVAHDDAPLLRLPVHAPGLLVPEPELLDETLDVGEQELTCLLPTIEQVRYFCAVVAVGHARPPMGAYSAP